MTTSACFGNYLCRSCFFVLFFSLCFLLISFYPISFKGGYQETAEKKIRRKRKTRVLSLKVLFREVNSLRNAHIMTISCLGYPFLLRLARTSGTETGVR